MKISEIPAGADNPEDPQPRMANTASGSIGSTPTIPLWPATRAAKRGPGRPKKPPQPFLTGLRTPKANGRPRNAVKPPGKPGAPKQHDDATMRAFVEDIDQRKSKAQAAGASISDDRAIRDAVIEHYQLEKHVVAKLALGLSKRAAEDRVFKRRDWLEEVYTEPAPWTDDAAR